MAHEWRDAKATARRGVFLTLVVAAGLAWAGDTRELAERLAGLRSEVATLQEDLVAARDALRADLRSLEQRKVEAEAAIRQAEARRDELQRLAERASERIQSDDAARTALVTPLLEALSGLREHVAAGLPWRRQERLEALETLERGLRDGSIDPRRGAGRVWAAVEDERRLARENALDRVALPLAEGEVLARAGRLGMVAMVWDTPDGRAGVAVRGAEGWTYPTVSGADATRVTELLDSLEKQVRTGFFELPWALEVGR